MKWLCWLFGHSWEQRETRIGSHVTCWRECRRCAHVFGLVRLRFYKIGPTEAEAPEWIFGMQLLKRKYEIRLRPPISFIIWPVR